MSEYINTRIRRVQTGYAVEAQTASPPDEQPSRLLRRKR